MTRKEMNVMPRRSGTAISTRRRTYQNMGALLSLRG